MKRVCLIHWNDEEGPRRAAALSGSQYEVKWGSRDPRALLEQLKRDPPDLVLIDLTRSPALGRDVGVALRVHGATRAIPLVFVGGAPGKVERARTVLPDAGYASWEEIDSAMSLALERPASEPIVPSSSLAGYAGTPLPKKLGIKAGYRVLLARAPSGVGETLGELPPDVRCSTRFREGMDLILWFVRSKAELDRGIESWAKRVEKGGIWILWPKKTGSSASDLSQQDVRRAGLDNGLVDFKICAFDEDWSGLKFSVRKERPK